MRLQSEIYQLGVFRVVVVFLGLDARIRQVVNLDSQAHLACRGLHQSRDVQDGKLLRELVEYAALAREGRVQARQLDATHGISNIQKAARLTSFAIDGQRMSDGCLDTKTVQDRTEDFIVIEAIDESLVEADFIGHGAVDDALVEIGGAELPDLAAEHDVVAVVNFREVIKRAGLFRVGKNVAAPVVLDGDVALFNINIRRAVFAHRTQLDQVTLRLEFLECEEQVEGAHNVVHLREDGVFPVDHRVGSGALLGKMDDGVGLERFDRGREKVVIGHVAGERFYDVPGEFLPDPQPVREGTNRRQGLHAEFMIPLPARKVVENGYRVALP